MARVGTRKRGASWQYYFEGAKVNGKRKQIVKSGFNSSKEAYDAGVKAYAEYHEGTLFEASTISVNDYMDEWLKIYAEVNLTPGTINNYKKIIDRYVRTNFGNMPLKSLKPAILQELLNRLKAEGKSKSYINTIRVVLRGSLEYAVRPLGYLKENPMQYVKNPRGTKRPKQRRVMTANEMRVLLKRFEGTPFHLPIMIGYHAGLRVSECYGLTWDAVDFNTNTLTINKQISYVDDEWVFAELKTASSYRTILFGDTLRKELLAAKKYQAEDRLRCGQHYKDTRNLVNAKQGGGFYTPNSFNYAVRVVHKELGLKDFSYHALRHTHATLLIENGANIKNVSARLGHSSISTTMDVYAHDTSKMEQQTVDIFENVDSVK